MILHIRIKPDGNGVAYIGTPEELKKRFNALRRAWYRDARAPFEVVHEIQVSQGGSKYYLINGSDCLYSICKREKYGASYVGGSYETFGPALNRLCKLVEKEAQA